MEKQTLRNAAIQLSKLTDLFDQWAKGHDLTFDDMELILKIFKDCDKGNEIIASAEELAHNNLSQLMEDAQVLSKECRRYIEIWISSAEYPERKWTFGTELLYEEKIKSYKDRFLSQVEHAHTLWDEYLVMSENLKDMSETDEGIEDYITKTAEKLSDYGKELRIAKQYSDEYEEQNLIAERDYLLSRIEITLLVKNLESIANTIIADIKEFERRRGDAG